MKGVPVPVDEYVSRFVELEFLITSQFCEIKTSPFHLNLEYLDSWPLHVWSELPRLVSRYLELDITGGLQSVQCLINVY